MHVVPLREWELRLGGRTLAFLHGSARAEKTEARGAMSAAAQKAMSHACCPGAPKHGIAPDEHEKGFLHLDLWLRSVNCAPQISKLGARVDGQGLTPQWQP